MEGVCHMLEGFLQDEMALPIMVMIFGVAALCLICHLTGIGDES